jgi:DNA-binding GntR family transcriptional regulator
LREAFRVLQEEGLVEAYPHRGVFVTTLSTRKVREVYTLRELLEPYAVGLAMENDAYGEQELQEIEALLRRLGELEQEGNAFGRAEAIAEFHYLICKPSDHHWLLDVLKSLRSFERLCIVNIILYDIEELSAEYQHRQIFDAIRAGDPAQAQAVLREHLIFSRNSTLVAMTAAEADSQ